MRGSDLSDLSVFTAVAEHLSFRVAAEQLGLTTSALSHRMRQLEERIGVRLLNRTTRSVALTDAGRRLLERVSPAIEQISSAVGDLAREREKPMGKLKIHTPTVTAEMILAPILREFLEKYPDVELELNGPDGLTDIVGAGFDAGISLQEFLALDMTAVRVIPNMPIAVVAAPSYFATRPIPKVPEDLLQHNCIRFRIPVGAALVNWTFIKSRTSRRLLAKTDVIDVKGNLIVGDISLALRAAVNGVGIAYTLESAADFFIKSGHLIRVLEEWSPSLEGFYFYYPGNRQIPAALRALIEMIKAGPSAQASAPLAGQAGHKAAKSVQKTGHGSPKSA